MGRMWESLIFSNLFNCPRFTNFLLGVVVVNHSLLPKEILKLENRSTI